MVPCVVNSRLHQRRAARLFHFRHRDETPVTATPLKSSLTNRDARNPFRIRSYENCRVSLALSSLFSLFTPRVFHNSFAIMRFRTLSQKHRVWGPFSSALCGGTAFSPMLRRSDVGTFRHSGELLQSHVALLQAYRALWG